MSFNFDHKAVLDEMLLTLPEVRAGKMFGYPAYFAGEKCCSCVYENGVSLKIPEERVKQLLVSDPNFAPFIPMGGRVMREWIQINLAQSVLYREYLPLFKESVEFVLASQKE